MAAPCDQNGPMEVVVTGASGLIGQALVTILEARGDRVRRLVRRPVADPSEIRWIRTAATSTQRRSWVSRQSSIWPVPESLIVAGQGLR